MKGIRQSTILNELDKNPGITVKELSEQLGVTMQTIRRDMQTLEENGFVKRKYGGAVLQKPLTSSISSIRERTTTLQPTKKALAEIAVEIVADGSTVAIDAGSTMLEVGKLLGKKKDLIVITNDIYLVDELLNNTEHRVYLVGGFMGKDGASAGEFVRELLSSISSIDTMFLSTDGITIEDGLTSDGKGVNDFKNLCLQKALKKIAVIDHTKFGIKHFYKTCDLDMLDCLVTDGKTPEKELEIIRSKGVEVKVSDSE